MIPGIVYHNIKHDMKGRRLKNFITSQKADELWGVFYELCGEKIQWDFERFCALVCLWRQDAGWLFEVQGSVFYLYNVYSVCIIMLYSNMLWWNLIVPPKTISPTVKLQRSEACFNINTIFSDIGIPIMKMIYMVLRLSYLNKNDGNFHDIC